ncbi:hypothetical protein DIPPA_12188 [Diplonema papillatum]|nr:hypothetical protein DIPPA_12188 [Diplonema papillatum]
MATTPPLWEADRHQAPLSDLAERLSLRHRSLQAVRSWLTAELDPNRTGQLGVTEFVCLWMTGIQFPAGDAAALAEGGGAAGAEGADPSAAAYGGLCPGCAGRRGGAAPGEAQASRKAAAVAAYMVARLVKREWDLELLDPGRSGAPPAEKLWYGPAAQRRRRSPERNADRQPPASRGAQAHRRGLREPPVGAEREGLLELTPAFFVAARTLAQDCEDVDGSLRFGSVSGFATALPNFLRGFPFLVPGNATPRPADLRLAGNGGGGGGGVASESQVRHLHRWAGALCLPPAGVHSVLDDLVAHAEATLPPGAWSEPAFPFLVVLSLVLKHAARPPEKEGFLRTFNDGVALFRALLQQNRQQLQQRQAEAASAAEGDRLSIRVLLRALALSAPNTFPDAVDWQASGPPSSVARSCW